MIFFVPVQDVNLEYINKSKAYVEEVYKEEVRILDKVPFPIRCFNEKRNQYNASCLLSRLPEFKGRKVVFICDMDLYEDGLNFVFGIAESMSGKKCIVSISRLKESFYGKKENEEILILRIAKEIIHELGHLKGLKHCPDKKCVMHFSNSLYDTDFKNYYFCNNCKRSLY